MDPPLRRIVLVAEPECFGYPTGTFGRQLRADRRYTEAMGKVSAGLLMYRGRGERLEVLLVHPGGPFWAKKDAGAWTIPKGEVGAHEDELLTAQREFEEETGIRARGEFWPLGTIKQKTGKTVRAWAFEGNCDPASVKSNTFLMEWPPRSGKKQEFPEVDRGEFFEIEEAKRRINLAQVGLLVEFERNISGRLREGSA
jgi:predicted NUDIX family NTP pyrophosphohydrolase